MKRFNVEVYAKNIFKDDTLLPKSDTWRHISNELDKANRKKKKNSFRFRMSMLLVILVGSIHFTGENPVPHSVRSEDDHVKIPKTPIAKDVYKIQNQLLPARLQSIKHTKRGAITKQGTEEVGASIVQKERPSVVAFHPMEHSVSEAEVVPNQKLATKLSSDPSVGSVTDSEIESLLKKARTNRAREHALSIIRKTNAHAMLMEIEYEIERPLERRLYQDAKQRYLKLKSIIAN